MDQRGDIFPETGGVGSDNFPAMQRINAAVNASRHTTLDQTIEEHVWCRRINSHHCNEADVVHQ